MAPALPAEGEGSGGGRASLGALCGTHNTLGQALIQAFPGGLAPLCLPGFAQPAVRCPAAHAPCPRHRHLPTLPQHPSCPVVFPRAQVGVHGASAGAWGKHWSLESSRVAPAKQQPHFPGKLASLPREPGRACRGLAVSQCTSGCWGSLTEHPERCQRRSWCRKGRVFPHAPLDGSEGAAAQGLGPLCRQCFPSHKLLFTCIGYFI